MTLTSSTGYSSIFNWEQQTYVSSSPKAKSSISSSSSEGSSRFNAFISSGLNMRWQVEQDNVPSQAPLVTTQNILDISDFQQSSSSLHRWADPWALEFFQFVHVPHKYPTVQQLN